MSPSAGKFICRACNRPFDPKGPGATTHMGPTCAKRAQSDLRLNGPISQLSMLEGADGHANPEAPAPVMSSPFAPPPLRARPNTKKLPAVLTGSYIKARNAFAELYRLYCTNGTLKYGEEARVREAELRTESREPYTLQDALLPWLEPEQDICMTVDADAEMIYVSRTLNDVPSFLEIHFSEPGPALHHRDTIVAHNLAVRAYSQAEDEIQLSLF